MSGKTPIEQHNYHMFEAASLAAAHFLEIEGANINDYASQKASQLEALIKLCVNLVKKEAVCPFEDIKFKAYKVDMKIDEWD